MNLYRFFCFLIALMIAWNGYAQDEHSLYVQFDQALLLGEFSEAKRIGEIYIQSFPDSTQTPRIEFWLGCFQDDYRNAVKQIESVARREEESELARIAYRRIVEFALLEGRTKDAINVLRTWEKRDRSNPNALNEIRLQLALAYLTLNRYRSAESVLSQIIHPETLPVDQKTTYLFSQALVLWQSGKNKEFWQKQLGFEEEMPNSHYLPTLLWIAATPAKNLESNRTIDQQYLLHDIINFYPNSPEASLAQKVLLK